MACQRGIFSGEFFWNQFLLVLEDLFEFLWGLDGTDKDSFEVADCFSFSSHIEDLGVQIIIFEWTPFERVVMFCFVFSFLRMFRLGKALFCLLLFCFDFVCSGCLLFVS